MTDAASLDAWIQRRLVLHRVFDAQTGFSGNASGLEHVGIAPTSWSPTELAGLWREAAARPGRQPAEEINHVYVHVPFCKSICHFCNYKRLRPGSAALMEIWRDRVVDAVAVLAPAVRDFRFHSLYFGGGTPSLLPPPLLDDVLGALSALPFVPDASRSFEADPAVLDDARIEVLVRHGIQHVSLGVQTLTEAVNASHDRGPQSRALVERRLESLARAGIKSTSLDFLLGLHDTTPAQMWREIDETLAKHRPRWIDLFFLTPTSHYVALHFGGSHEAFWEHQRGFAETATQALVEICARHGYDLHGSTGDAFVLRRRGGVRGPFGTLASRALDRLADVARHDPKWLGGLPGRLVAAVQRREGDSPYAYNHLVAEQHRPLNLLGLGTGARGRIFGVATYEADDPGGDPARSGPAVFRGHRTDLAFEARAYLLKVLRDENQVPGDRMRRLFGIDLPTLLPDTVGAWKRLGIAHARGDVTALTRQDREERNRALMWLLADADIEQEIARHRKMDLSADAILGLLAPLKPGAPVDDGVTLSAVEDAALVLARADGASQRVRVSPRLDRTTGLTLVPEGNDAGLRTALERIAKLLRRNGADELGIREPGASPRDTVFTHAGQIAPAAVGTRRPRQGASGRPAPVHDASEDAPTPLAEAKVASYWQDGVLVGVPVLRDDERERLVHWLEAIEAEQSARHGGRWTERDFRPDLVTTHPLLDWVDEIVTHPRLLDAVESLLGPDLFVRNVDIFAREPHTRDGVVWHRDSAAQGPGTDRMLTAWIGLHGATADNGALEFLRGSHRGTLPGEALTPDHLDLPTRPLKKAGSDKLVLGVMPPGQASLHHLRTAHRSGGNRTSGRRVAIVVRFAAADVPADVATCGIAKVVRGRLDRPDIQTRSHVPIAWVG